MNVGALSNSVSPVSDIQPTSAVQPIAGTPSSSTAASDSVELSDSAQATAMHQQGLSVKEIASNLGVTAQVVNGYLGITTTTSVPGGGGGGGGARPQAKTIPTT